MLRFWWSTVAKERWECLGFFWSSIASKKGEDAASTAVDSLKMFYFNLLYFFFMKFSIEHTIWGWMDCHICAACFFFVAVHRSHSRCVCLLCYISCRVFFSVRQLYFNSLYLFSRHIHSHMRPLTYSCLAYVHFTCSHRHRRWYY